MDILNNKLFERKYDGLYMDDSLLYEEALIPFYLNHDMFFYSKTRSLVFNSTRTKELSVTIDNVHQITSQENIIIWNDTNNVYICDDNFNVLSKFSVKIESNFIVFGRTVVFKHLDELWSIDLSTFRCSKFAIQFPLKTNEISGYTYDNKPIVCDTNTFHLSNDEDFRFGGSKMRVSHVYQSHYDRIFRNVKTPKNHSLYDIFEHTMKYICDNTRDVEIENDQEILKLFDESYVKNFIENHDVFTRDDYVKNRVILSNENAFIDDNVMTELNDKLDGLFRLTEYPMAGPFYYYAPIHALSWHTNMETDPKSFRMYNVYCTKDYSSFFCYLHPYSKLVHIVGDKNMHTNVFNIGP